MRILLVEDDPQLGNGISSALLQEGYAVDWLNNGESARQAISLNTFDLIILDIGLPQMDGLTLVKLLRFNGDTTPVLILTARDTVADRVKGLDVGADDYMIKPFELEELFARIRALLRRKVGRAKPMIEYGDIVVDPAAHRVTSKGEPVSLSSKEFAVLNLLLDHVGSVLSRRQIEESIYGWNEAVESNATEVHIHHLRKKLGKKLILTVRGIGYMIPEEQ